MQLTSEEIREFTQVWKEEFGEGLSEAEARHHASQLLEIYRLLTRGGEPHS